MKEELRLLGHSRLHRDEWGEEKRERDRDTQRGEKVNFYTI